MLFRCAIFVLLSFIKGAWTGAVELNCTDLPAVIGLLPSEGEPSVFAADDLVRLPNASIVMKYYSNLFRHWAKIKKIFIPLDERYDSTKLSNAVYKQLHGVDVIVGPYYPAIEGYAKLMNIAYILTKPPSLKIQRKMQEETNDQRVLFSIWPSWESFYKDSLEALLDSKGATDWGIRSLGRVLIIREGLNEESFEVANLLLNTLLESGRTTRVKLVTLSEAQEDDPFSILNKVIVPIKPHIIVYLYERRDDLKLLFTLYKTIIVDHHAGAEIMLAEWYFWDMTSPYSGLMRNLLTGDGYQMARKLKLRSVNLQPCEPLDQFHCDTAEKESTEMMGFAETMEFSMLMMCKYEMFHTVKELFLSIMRITDLRDATIPLATYCQTHITAGLSFQNGFRIFPGIHVGSLRPKKEIGKDHQTHVYLDCSSKTELHWTRYYDEETKTVKGIIKEKTRKPQITDREPDSPVKVVVVLEEPFAFQDKYSREWKGLCVEMVKLAFDMMSKRQGSLIKYELYATKLNQYGSLNRTNRTWSGAMGELQSGRAEVAIGMISKTKDRKRYFDFTPAYEFVGITYIAKKEEHPGSMFGFLKPFENKLWWGILAVCFLSAVFIRILDYWNPFNDNVDDANRFDLNESMWYSFGVSSGAGGGEFAPYMFPARVYSTFYWFFALIITASYTGNLASFLVEKYEILPTLKLHELPYKKNYEWGTLNGSFMESHIRSMSGSYETLAEKLQLHYANYSAGVERVKGGGFAFIGNNLLLKDFESKDPSCTLAVSDEVEAFTELAFPINRKWPKKREFINAMIRMRADGTIADVLKRWIRFEAECVNPEAEDEEEHTSLDLNNFYGLYVVLAVSFAISFVVLFMKLGYLKLRDRYGGKRRGSQAPEEAKMNDKEAPLATPDSDDRETDV